MHPGHPHRVLGCGRDGSNRQGTGVARQDRGWRAQLVELGEYPAFELKVFVDRLDHYVRAGQGLEIVAELQPLLRIGPAFAGQVAFDVFPTALQGLRIDIGQDHLLAGV